MDHDIDECLQKFVIDRMRVDHVTRLVKSDSMILKFGLMQLHKLGQRRALDISSRMRELARLLLRLQSTEKGRNIHSFLKGRMFEWAIEDEAQPITVDGRKTYQKPAFVIKLGNTLLKCAQLKRGTALRQGQKESEDFILLHINEFTDRMASAAHTSFALRVTPWLNVLMRATWGFWEITNSKESHI